MVVFDPSDRVLLINAKDPLGSGRSWWEVPGGGIDPGESTADTARRELWEEAGIRDASIGPCVWTQRVSFTFAGMHFDQQEWVHVARCDGVTSAPGGLEALEVLAFGQQRWWTIDELIDQQPRTIPYRMIEFLPSLLHSIPDEPLDITPDEAAVQRWRTAD